MCVCVGGGGGRGGTATKADKRMGLGELERFHVCFVWHFDRGGGVTCVVGATQIQGELPRSLERKKGVGVSRIAIVALAQCRVARQTPFCPAPITDQQTNGDFFYSDNELSLVPPTSSFAFL